MKSQTESPQTPAETPEQIADRIAKSVGFDTNSMSRDSETRLAAAILCAMLNERTRAARIIKEHRESDICKDNCWTTITNLILGEGR